MSIESQLKKAAERKESEAKTAIQKDNPEKTAGEIEADQIRERNAESETQKQAVAEQQQGPTEGAKEAEQLKERAAAESTQRQQQEKQAKEARDRTAKEAEKKSAEKAAREAEAKKHSDQVQYDQLVKEARAEDLKQLEESKAAKLAFSDQSMSTKDQKKTNGPKLERGGDEAKPIRDADLRGLDTTRSSGFERVSKETVITDFTHERDLRGAGTEHLQNKAQAENVNYPARFGTPEELQNIAAKTADLVKNWNSQKAIIDTTSKPAATEQKPLVEAHAKAQTAPPGYIPAVPQEIKNSASKTTEEKREIKPELELPGPVLKPEQIAAATVLAAAATAVQPAPEAQQPSLLDVEQPDTQQQPAGQGDKPAAVKSEQEAETEKKPETDTDIDQRFGAEAIPGTQAAKDRDEMNAEDGNGYRETAADQVTDERIREGDGFKDLVPTEKAEVSKQPEPEPVVEIEKDYADEYGL